MGVIQYMCNRIWGVARATDIDLQKQRQTYKYTAHELSFRTVELVSSE